MAMATVAKKVIINDIAKEVGISQAEVRKTVNCFVNNLKKQYQAGNKVEFRGFGTFFPYFRKARSYKDPVTKSEKQMKDRTILKFKSSHQLFI
jgi:nucleoid DNA-binding protein